MPKSPNEFLDWSDDPRFNGGLVKNEANNPVNPDGTVTSPAQKQEVNGLLAHIEASKSAWHQPTNQEAEALISALNPHLAGSKEEAEALNEKDKQNWNNMFSDWIKEAQKPVGKPNDVKGDPWAVTQEELDYWSQVRGSDDGSVPES